MILVPLAGLVLLILSIVVTLVSLVRWLTRRERPYVLTFLPLVVMLVFYFSPIHMPSKMAMTFYLHRDEFIALADSSVSKLRNTNKLGFQIGTIH